MTFRQRVEVKAVDIGMIENREEKKEKLIILEMKCQQCPNNAEQIKLLQCLWQSFDS